MYFKRIDFTVYELYLRKGKGLNAKFLMVHQALTFGDFYGEKCLWLFCMPNTAVLTDSTLPHRQEGSPSERLQIQAYRASVLQFCNLRLWTIWFSKCEVYVWVLQFIHSFWTCCHFPHTHLWKLSVLVFFCRFVNCVKHFYNKKLIFIVIINWTSCIISFSSKRAEMKRFKIVLFKSHKTIINLNKLSKKPFL